MNFHIAPFVQPEYTNISRLHIVAQAFRTLLTRWSERRAQKRSDAKIWATALSDARVMSDIQAAISRGAA